MPNKFIKRTIDYHIETIEPNNYINKAETFQHRLTGRDQEELYKTYTILPHKHRNEVSRHGSALPLVPTQMGQGKEDV